MSLEGQFVDGRRLHEDDGSREEGLENIRTGKCHPRRIDTDPVRTCPFRIAYIIDIEKSGRLMAAVV